MGKKIIYGFYDDDDVMLEGVKSLKANKVKVIEAYTPFPVHGLDKALGLKPTRIAITSFMYGLTGLTLALTMVYCMMIVDWPMDIGGKPNFTLRKNLPSFVPILFECTVLFAAHLTVITLLIRNQTYPFKKADNPDPSTTDDKFVIELKTNEKDIKKIKTMLKKTGAIEVKEKTT